MGLTFRSEAMNCQKGDVAMVIGEGPNVGMVVTCLRLASPWDIFKAAGLNPSEYVLPDIPFWEIDTPVSWSLDGRVQLGRIAFIEDRCLRPFPPARQLLEEYQKDITL